MNKALKVTRLHLNKRNLVFLTPLGITAIVWVVSVIIILIIQRAGMVPTSPNYVEGARQNLGIVWSLPGFLVYLGVQAVATTFPFALALGATRKAYVTGTAFFSIVQAAYIAGILGVLLLLELATNHWFIGIYVLDIYALGAGNLGILLATVFIGVFLLLSIGGVFGAMWVRFGAKGPAALGLALAVLLALLVLLLVPYAAEIIAVIQRFRLTTPQEKCFGLSGWPQ